ncbi:YeiH family protein [Thermodesulfobacteriota bacterium]
MTKEKINGQVAEKTPEAREPSVWSALPSFRKSWPGLLAMAILALLCGLPGLNFLFTLDTLLHYIDAVLPPIYGKGFFTDLLHMNYVVNCLIVGIVVRNIIGVPNSWEPGLTYSGTFMNAGIIMLGSQYLLSDLVKLGGVSIVVMIFMVFGGALIFTFMGRLAKMGDSMTALLAAGFSMCGVSACIAISPMVKSKSEEVAYAIAVSVTFGLFCLFALPFLGHLIGMTNDAFGLLSAAGVPNSNQVIATGFNYSFEAGRVAGFTNIGRLVLIPGGVLFIYFMTLGKEIRSSSVSIWQVIIEKFPIFIVGFAIVWTLNCLKVWPLPASQAMGRVMEWFFSLSFVGLGLLTKLSDLRKAGPKGLVIGYSAGSLRLILCLILIYIATKMGMLN